MASGINSLFSFFSVFVVT